MDEGSSNIRASLLVSTILDKIGYSSFDFAHRRKLYDAFSQAVSPVMTVGSKREGLTNVLESDFDQLRFDTTMIVVEDDKVYEADIGIMRQKSCSPGYTMIYLYNETNIKYNSWILSSRRPCDEMGTFVSSSLFMKLVDINSANNSEAKKQPRHGPSIPQKFKLGMGSYDYVLTLKCECPSILQAWKDRQRNFEWPSVETQQLVIKKDLNLASHGCEGDPFFEDEWRICFNLGEIELMKSLNTTITKVYILLKMVTKEIIKPQNKEISSFLLKNVVFWISELTPQSAFTDDSVYYWFKRVLLITKHSIKTGYLPYYMIPQRNLLQGKLNKSSQSKIMQQISAVLRLGPDVMFYPKKLQAGLAVQKIDKLEIFGMLRRKIEHFVLDAIVEVARQERRDYGNEEMSIFDLISDDLWEKLQNGYLSLLLTGFKFPSGCSLCYICKICLFRTEYFLG